MPLQLVTGPANSGKTGEILGRFTEALAHEPVLVVPTRADVERFEDELLARRPVAMGGRLATFDDLFRLAARATGAVTAPVLSSSQRAAVIAAVVRDAELRALAAPARRLGFAGALDGFIAEAQAARVPLGELAARLQGMPGAHLRELAALCEAYQARLASLGRADAHTAAAEAVAALARDPRAWGRRPVFIHGFDDLTREQLALVGALAAGCEVTISLIHEPGRAALAARERLLALLLSLGGASPQPLEPHEGAGLLSQLERGFLVDGAPAAEPDGGLVLLDAAGRRNEVEQVGAEIAALLREGVLPEEVAVIARSPDEHAALIEQVFASYGIPVSVDARVPFARTVLGQGLLALIRLALTTRTAGDLLAYLRTPGRAATHNQVDRLERAVRTGRLRTADEALAAWAAEERRDLWELERLREAERAGPPALVEAVAGLARDMFEWPLRRSAPLLDPAARLDQLAAERAGRALAELSELASEDPSLAPGAEGLCDLLGSLEVRRGAAPLAGHVEVMSPYRARARRFRHVFVISLQEGEFPRRGSDDPFLTEEERAAAGLPQRADQRDEERYLFYSCISRPTRRLHLSYRSSGDDGRESPRSLFVDDLLDLVATGSEERIKRSKTLADTVFEPARAPSEDELARSLAAAGVTEPPSELGLGTAMAGRLADRLHVARERATFLPGDLIVPSVRAAFAERTTFGASSLETYAECSFRYFVDHELSPRELVPEADARARGSLVHDVLEKLYRELGAPAPGDVDRFAARARELLAEGAAGTALAPVTPAARAVYRRLESDLLRFVAHDAAQPVGLPFMAAEASFGKDGDEHGPLELGGGIRLHGKIDRIDGAPGGPAFIRDYKSGRNVASRTQMVALKRLQLPLYMLAVEELWGMEPVGGVYHPLGKQDSQAARGLVRGPREEAVVDAGLFTGRDVTASAEEFREHLDSAREEAITLAGGIRAGRLDRNPLGGSCPRHCGFHPICRRDRGEKNPEEDQPAREGAGDG